MNTTLIGANSTKKVYIGQTKVQDQDGYIKRADILFVQKESATRGPLNKFLGERLQDVSSARPPSTSTIAVQDLLGVIRMHQRLHIVDLQYKDKGPGAPR